MWRADSERGSVLILTIAMAGLLVAVVLVAVDVSALALQRREAESIADGAARSAAQALDLAGYYAGAGGRRLPLDEWAARRRAEQYVGPPWRVSHFEVTESVVSVTVSRDLDLALSQWVGRERVVVNGSAAASLLEQP